MTTITHNELILTEWNGLLLPDGFQGGNYDTWGLVGKSNGTALLEQFDDLPYLVNVSDRYGYEGTGIDTEELPEDGLAGLPTELLEAIWKVQNDYPLMDEELYSEMEFNQALEDWDTYGKTDVIKEILADIPLHINQEEAEMFLDNELELHHCNWHCEGDLTHFTCEELPEEIEILEQFGSVEEASNYLSNLRNPRYQWNTKQE